MSLLALPPLTRPAVLRAAPLGTLVMVELRKCVDTRAGRWLFAAGAAAVAVVIAVTVLVGGDETATRTLVNVAQFPLGVLLPVVGILCVTGEWSARTALVTFTLVPNRWRVVLAKVLALTVVALVAQLVTVLAAAIGSGAAAAAFGQTDWTLGAGHLARLGLANVLTALVGLSIGLLVQQSALAVVAFFVLPQVASLVLGLVPALAPAADWLDLMAATAPLASVSGMDGAAWAHLASATACWLVLPLLAGLIRLGRREIG